MLYHEATTCLWEWDDRWKGCSTFEKVLICVQLPALMHTNRTQLVFSVSLKRFSENSGLVCFA